jgi:PAS domain S-box-containing protein
MKEEQMTDKWKIMSIILGLFLLFGGLLIFLENVQIKKMTESGNPSLVLWTILILGGLFLCILFFINNGCTRISEKVERYKQQLVDTDNALKEAQSEFNETVERRTFEISVINASLNREIAERIQAESESRKLQRQMELILQSAGEGIFGLDLEGNVTFVNKAATVMLGWTPEELVGKSHHDLVHHTHADGTPYSADQCPINRTCHDGQVHFSSDDVFWCKDGSSFPVEYVSTPIMEDHMLTGAVVVFRDMNTFA